LPNSVVRLLGPGGGGQLAVHLHHLHLLLLLLLLGPSSPGLDSFQPDTNPQADEVSRC